MRSLRWPAGLVSLSLAAGALWILAVGAIERFDAAWAEYRESAAALVPIDLLGRRLALRADLGEDEAKGIVARAIRRFPNIAAYCRGELEDAGMRPGPREIPAPCGALPDTKRAYGEADFLDAADSIVFGSYRYSQERQAHLVARARVAEIATLAFLPAGLLLAMGVAAALALRAFRHG